MLPARPGLVRPRWAEAGGSRGVAAGLRPPGPVPLRPGLRQRPPAAGPRSGRSLAPSASPRRPATAPGQQAMKEIPSPPCSAPGRRAPQSSRERRSPAAGLPRCPLARSPQLAAVFGRHRFAGVQTSKVSHVSLPWIH